MEHPFKTMMEAFNLLIISSQTLLHPAITPGNHSSLHENNNEKVYEL